MTWLKNKLSKSPESVFIEFNSKKYSYSDLEEMANAYAQSLLRENN